MEESKAMRTACFLAVFLLCAAAANTAAQDGGAYYEFLLGQHLENAGDADGAAAAYQRAETLDPQTAEIPAALASLYARMNRTADAVTAAERAVKINPKDSEANWILGNLYARMAEVPTTRAPDRAAYVQKAVAALERTDQNAHPGVPVMLGRMYLSQQQFDKAVAILKPFVEEEPDQIEAVALLAEAYEETGHGADAVALLEKAVEDAPELYTTLAEVYENSGRWSDAAKAYEGAVQDRPQSLRLREEWAKALLYAGDAPRARQVLEEGAASGSRDLRALYLLTEAQRRMKDGAAAEATARKMIALDPQNLTAQRELAHVFEDQHDYRRVVATLEPIVTARFKSADAKELADEAFRPMYFDLVGAYEELKQFDKAVGLLMQAKQLAPADYAIDIRLASTYQKEKKFSDAEKVLRQVIIADKSNADALNSLGYLLAERGQKLDESVEFVERALTIDPGNPAYLDSLGWAFFKQGKFESAEIPLRQAADKLPSVSVIQDHFGEVLAKRGAYEEAIAAWQRALDGDGDDITPADIQNKIKSAREQQAKKK